MRRLLLLAALAAGLAGTTGSAHATSDLCVARETCLYTDGGYWCTRQTGPNGNWTEYCVGATGMRECWYTFPDPNVHCMYVPGPITR